MLRLRRLWDGHHGLILTVACFVCVLTLALRGFSAVGRETDAKQQAALRRAVVDAAATCYATEGFYPSSAGYLEDNYGLRYDKARYIIQYDCFAENVMPEIRVLTKGADGT